MKNTNKRHSNGKNAVPSKPQKRHLFAVWQPKADGRAFKSVKRGEMKFAFTLTFVKTTPKPPLSVLLLSVLDWSVCLCSPTFIHFLLA